MIGIITIFKASNAHSVPAFQQPGFKTVMSSEIAFSTCFECLRNSSNHYYKVAPDSLILFPHSSNVKGSKLHFVFCFHETTGPETEAINFFHHISFCF